MIIMTLNLQTGECCCLKRKVCMDNAVKLSLKQEKSNKYLIIKTHFVIPKMGLRFC